MKQIVCVGLELPPPFEGVDLDSNGSLGHADIAIFCPDFKHTSYSHEYGLVAGKKTYDAKSSANIIQHAAHWKLELQHFVARGGVLYIVLPNIDQFNVHTGSTKTSGSGRNAQVTHETTGFSNYGFLPFKGVTFHASSGLVLVPTSPLVRDLFEEFTDYMIHEVYFDLPQNATQLFATKDGTRVLGAHLPLEKGHVVFLPHIDFDSEALMEEVYNEEIEEHLDEWSEEGVRKGTIWSGLFVGLASSMAGSLQRTPTPTWASEQKYSLRESELIHAEVKKTALALSKLQVKQDNLVVKLDEAERLKDLLFETGKPLEAAVIKALKILGYQADPFQDDTLELDQIILSPEGGRFIGECEGKDTKAIDVSKFRQLFAGIHEDMEKNETSTMASGILFGNPQRLMYPSTRTLDFTKKCIEGAIQHHIRLITTVSLFQVVKIIQDSGDLDYARLCRIVIAESLGGIVSFPLHL